MDRDRIKSITGQFIKFGLVGGVNTITGLVIYWILVGIGVHYFIANAVGFVITVAISYVLNNIFTFKEKGQEVSWSFLTLLKVYASYFMTGIALNSALLWFLNDYIGINKNLSPVLNLCVTIPINFLVNKFWAYKKKDRDTDKDEPADKETE